LGCRGGDEAEKRDEVLEKRDEVLEKR